MGDSGGAIRATLVDGGRFAFETRDPRARAWEGWNTSFDIRNPDGEEARVEYEVQDVKDDVVRFTETLSGQWWDRDQTEHGALRFLGREALTTFLHKAGFVVDDQFGDGHRRPLTERDHHDRAARCPDLNGSPRLREHS